jgi:hypothetical protein
MAHARLHKRQRKLGEEALCLIGKAEKYFLKLFRIPTKHAVNDE